MPRITKTGALRISLIGIFSVIVVEGLAGIITGSLALVSDSAHAGFDAVSTFILLVATRLSLKPADEDHTYGHGKIETLGALIGGFILLVLAGAIVVLAILRVTSGSHPKPSTLGYGAASYTMAVDLLRMGILTAAMKSGSLTVKADLYHAISDFFSTSLVFVALFLTSLGYPIGDTAVSLVLAGLLTFLSLRLIRASALDLSDAVSGKLVKSIFSEIHKTGDVLKTKELRVRRAGETTFVDAVIAVSPFVGVADADMIASRIEANLTRLLGKSSIMLHIEPLEWDIPIELQVRHATSKVEGARGVHDLSIARISGGLYVTLHVQVDAELALTKAHEIAEAVETGIKNAVPNVRQVTVHLEPSRAERTGGTMVDDKKISDIIRSVIETHPGVAEIGSILIYSTEDELRINVHCFFAGEENIAKIHETVSEIEDQIRLRIPEAVVTIHPEPVQRTAKAAGNS
jgi:cation diffusion facilitator family transporter